MNGMNQLCENRDLQEQSSDWRTLLVLYPDELTGAETRSDSCFCCDHFSFSVECCWELEKEHSYEAQRASIPQGLWTSMSLGNPLLDDLLRYFDRCVGLFVKEMWFQAHVQTNSITEIITPFPHSNPSTLGICWDSTVSVYHYVSSSPSTPTMLSSWDSSSTWSTNQIHTDTS